MDPLSLTASILAITTACLKSAHLLDGLREKYKHAQVTISALCAEVIVISASLSQIQSLVLANPGAIITQLRSISEVIATFDTALTGCSVVIAVLNDEITALVTSGQEGITNWRQRAKLIWKDDLMKDLLQQLRGQSAAIGLLIQTLQMYDTTSLREVRRANRYAENQCPVSESYSSRTASYLIASCVKHDRYVMRIRRLSLLVRSSTTTFWR